MNGQGARNSPTDVITPPDAVDRAASQAEFDRQVATWRECQRKGYEAQGRTPPVGHSRR